MTQKQRMLAAARGDRPDRLPYAPRIDLWHSANALAGTLPERHRGKSADQIALDEGWALHKVVAEHRRQPDPDAMLHRALGVHALREYVVKFVFSDQVGIDVRQDGDTTRIRYTTPKGTLTTATVYSEEMQRSGTSVPWIAEHLIKGPEDYRVAASLFELMDVVPTYEGFEQWSREVGEHGLPVTGFTVAASPVHHIQKYFLDATEFFVHYRDHAREMQHLASALAPLYEKALHIVADSPAEVSNWGSNFDDMITFAPLFQKEFLPWLRKAAEVLGPKNVLVLCHTDGENQGLMDLLHDSGMNIAEAVCPHPMTKVPIQEYYRRWGDKVTIFGGIPSNMLLPRLASDEEFEAFLDELLLGIAPGDRFILGIADTTPRDADFERLVRIGELVEERGRLPLEAGATRFATPVPEVHEVAAPTPKLDARFEVVQRDILEGRHAEILAHVDALLAEGVDAGDLVQDGMISAMEVINQRFRDGTVFIPEVLLSAKAMNLAVEHLEPHLAADRPRAKGTVLIGTVKGDLHDIGKNLVAAVLRGVGFKVVDLGINVPVATFVEAVARETPQVVALSALLTTTMPEMEKVIQALQTAGLRDQVKVIIGGAPVNQRFADDIGADGFGRDAAEAVTQARRLLAA